MCLNLGVPAPKARSLPYALAIRSVPTALALLRFGQLTLEKCDGCTPKTQKNERRTESSLAFFGCGCLFYRFSKRAVIAPDSS